ncbi:MAG: glycosyltransferase family 4 protein [Chloroflexi bacterium]|nr:glycosyltransferase family 4 protein [Chloroflexota bacterium]
MKIAQISTSWLRTPPTTYGGTEAVVSVLTEQLIALGCDVTLCATGDSVTQAKFWSWFDAPTPGYRITDEMIHVVKAYAYLRQSHFDIIHNHTYHVGPAPLSLMQTPSVTTYHGAYDPVATAFHANFASTHRYISLSKRHRELLPQLNWIDTVYNAVDTSEFTFETDKDDYLLLVGALLPWKGAHLAIQAAKTLGQHLKIVGLVQKIEDNSSTQNMVESYYSQEIAPKVDGHLIEYVGEVSLSHKIALYQHAKALLVPLLWEEPFGLTMIEALACGTPVIAFNKGAAPEIIVHEQVGFLVNNVEEMLAATKQIERISPQACREHVERHFNPQIMAQRYLEVYAQVISAYK